MHAYEFRAGNNSTECDINVSLITVTKGTAVCRYLTEHVLSADIKFHAD